MTSAKPAPTQSLVPLETTGYSRAFNVKPPPKPDPELLRLLEMAAEQLRCFPNDLISSPRFTRSHDVAEFIEESTAQLRRGSPGAGHDLLLVFLPTSAWDDAGGTQDIANRLCELLEPYRNTGDLPDEQTESPRGDNS